MKTAALFDIDNTLTPPRQPITESMVQILDHLCVPFHVAAGSHLPLLMQQFFEPLYQFGYRKQFDAFLSNGAIHYRCDFSVDMAIEVVSSFNIRNHLGEPNYRFLIETLKKTQMLPEFQLPPPLKVIGETIVFRDSMVNFAPIGRVQQEDAEIQLNRKNFVEYDHFTGYRQIIMDHLNNKLSSLIKNNDLKITLGGQTSFDIGILGKDKTNAVTTLFNLGFERIVFFGDALFEGGNDAVVREFAEAWPSTSPQSIETVQVDSYKETIEKLYEFNFFKKPI